MKMMRVAVMMMAVSAWIVSPVAAAGPHGGGGTHGSSGSSGNAGGAVRGLDRAEDVAAPQGQKGIENAEQKIEPKDNPRNPNSKDKDKDTDTTKQISPKSPK
jgi:hypothetical protein